MANQLQTTSENLQSIVAAGRVGRGRHPTSPAFVGCISGLGSSGLEPWPSQVIRGGEHVQRPQRSREMLPPMRLKVEAPLPKRLRTLAPLPLAQPRTDVAVDVREIIG